jgi:hypothetical protein
MPSNGQCVAFDYNNAPNQGSKWKEYANEIGPPILGGILDYWRNRQKSKSPSAPTPAGTPANPPEPNNGKSGMPVWGWILIAVAVIVALVLLLKRK